MLDMYGTSEVGVVCRTIGATWVWLYLLIRSRLLMRNRDVQGGQVAKDLSRDICVRTPNDSFCSHTRCLS